MGALQLAASWPVSRVAVGYTTGGGHRATHGEVDGLFELASVTKLLTTMAVLVAVEEGTVELDEPAGGLAGVTVRHLLAHTSGLPFEGEVPVSRPGARRVYSNTGIERVAQHLEARSDVPFATYLQEAVLEPLGMAATALVGSPAAEARSSLADLLALGAELLRPTLLAPETIAEATAVQFPGISGIVPGIGRMDPCDWGLGFELRDAKVPHWTGSSCSPATFGHFGGAGTFLWVDPVAGVAGVGLTDRGFDQWALDLWPPLADAILAEVGGDVPLG